MNTFLMEGGSEKVLLGGERTVNRQTGRSKEKSIARRRDMKSATTSGAGESERQSQKGRRSMRRRMGTAKGMEAGKSKLTLLTETNDWLFLLLFVSLAVTFPSAHR